MRPQPRPPVVPHLWRHGEVRPQVWSVSEGVDAVVAGYLMRGEIQGLGVNEVRVTG